MFLDSSNPIPIYEEIDFDNNDIPFGLPQARRENQFGSIRCEKIEFVPHGHTTHLETGDHLKATAVTACLPLCLSEPLYTQIIDPDSGFEIKEGVQFVVIKTRNPKKRDFQGVNAEIIGKIIATTSVKVIGINEPSFDPEYDDGELLAHRKAFRHGLYLVEMLNLSSNNLNLNEFYHCLLNIFRFSRTDAYPCSPILYPLK